LQNLACNNAEAREQRLSGIEASETCVNKSSNFNEMREYVLKFINKYNGDRRYSVSGNDIITCIYCDIFP